jgi:hypothetical protein
MKERILRMGPPQQFLRTIPPYGREASLALPEAKTVQVLEVPSAVKARKAQRAKLMRKARMARKARGS